MVIMKFDVKNTFGSLCAILVLDVLSGKTSRDYACGIKVDEDFETAVHELRAYFGFFKLARTCESILRFYSYDGVTNYLKLKTGGLQGDPPEFMVFCIVTLHLWGRIFKMLHGRWQHNWSAFTSSEACRCKQAGVQVRRQLGL